MRLGWPGSSPLAWVKTERPDARRYSFTTALSSRNLTALARAPFTEKRSFGRDRDRHIIPTRWQRLTQRALIRWKANG